MAAIKVPRIDRVVPADVFKVAVMYSIQKLGYDKPSEEQEKAVSKFLKRTRCIYKSANWSW